MTKTEEDSEPVTRCENYGGTVFLVDETCTHVEIDGEIVKTYLGDLCNRNCMRCVYPEVYRDHFGDPEAWPD
ncbi:MAG: hypothetical protein V1790_16345 [Planctomycetota bacterium]